MAAQYSGVLLHITSLPSPGGIGTLGQQARDFADFLAQAGQDIWQVLPLTPTGAANSPYQIQISSTFGTWSGVACSPGRS